MLNDAAGTHAFATGGLPYFLEKISSVPKVPENPDPDLFVGIGDPNDASSRTYATFKVPQLPALLERDGPVARQLGLQWVVFVYAEWEQVFRPRLAAARGCSVDDVRVSVFGDLRLIRNVVLHDTGDTRRALSRCEVLRWFSAGEPIVVKSEQIAEFMAVVPWDELGGA